jgi:hypothetical protein
MEDGGEGRGGQGVRSYIPAATVDRFLGIREADANWLG